MVVKYWNAKAVLFIYFDTYQVLRGTFFKSSTCISKFSLKLLLSHDMVHFTGKKKSQCMDKFYLFIWAEEWLPLRPINSIQFHAVHYTSVNYSAVEWSQVKCTSMQFNPVKLVIDHTLPSHWQAVISSTQDGRDGLKNTTKHLTMHSIMRKLLGCCAELWSS